MSLEKSQPQDAAKRGLELIEQAILRYLSARPLGAINNEIARELGLESDFNGKQKKLSNLLGPRGAYEGWKNRSKNRRLKKGVCTDGCSAVECSNAKTRIHSHVPSGR